LALERAAKPIEEIKAKRINQSHQEVQEVKDIINTRIEPRIDQLRKDTQEAIQKTDQQLQQTGPRTQ